jgi:hypothetical protein
LAVALSTFLVEGQVRTDSCLMTLADPLAGQLGLPPFDFSLAA